MALRKKSDLVRMAVLLLATVVIDRAIYQHLGVMVVVIIQVVYGHMISHGSNIDTDMPQIN